MSGTAGDAHIWLASTGDAPVAACGYTPPLEDVVEKNRDDEDVVVGQQVVHADPTGETCAECIAAFPPAEDPEPEDDGE